MNSEPQRIRPGVLLAAVCLALLAALLMIRAGHFLDYGASTAIRPIVDFDAFHVAGQLALSGDFDKAYHARSMEMALRTLGHGDKLMPWTYPPLFGLIVGPLATLPLGHAYLAFTGLTLAAYLAVLRRLAGDFFGLALAATLPAAVINLACGQNGFLTGALAGLAALGALRGGGGLPLGLMAIKPHLAAALGIEALMARRWRQVIVAVLTAGLATVLSTLVFGGGIWAAFLAGVAEARGFLAEGRYPLHRMVSLYAALASFGVPTRIALGAQVLLAGAMVLVLWRAARQGLPPRLSVGLAVLAAPFFSPYLYDYDLTLAGIGLALLLPALAGRLTATERAGLIVLSFASGSYGLVQAVGLGVASATAGVLSPIGLVAPLMVAITARAAFRNGRVRLSSASSEPVTA